MNRKTTSLLAALSAGILLASGCSGPQGDSSQPKAGGRCHPVHFSRRTLPGTGSRTREFSRRWRRIPVSGSCETVTWDEYGQFAGGTPTSSPSAPTSCRTWSRRPASETVTFRQSSTRPRT